MFATASTGFFESSHWLDEALTPCLGASSQSSPLEVSVYHTLADLRDQIQQVDAHVQHVVIVLDERFHGYAPSLLGRAGGGRLTLVALGGALAGMHREARVNLGWDHVVLRRDALSAVSEALAHAGEEQVLVLWPAWREPCD